tara:strand:- start:804 stop:1040 length:237 start_codon:yes stop_codon:yes gene_type:complete
MPLVTGAKENNRRSVVENTNTGRIAHDAEHDTFHIQARSAEPLGEKYISGPMLVFQVGVARFARNEDDFGRLRAAYWN